LFQDGGDILQNCPRLCLIVNHVERRNQSVNLPLFQTTSGGSMRGTGNNTERRAPTLNCAPRAKPSAASGSNESCASMVSGRTPRRYRLCTTDSKH